MTVRQSYHAYPFKQGPRLRDGSPARWSYSERDDSQSWNGLEVPYIHGRDAVAKLQRRRRDQQVLECNGHAMLGTLSFNTPGELGSFNRHRICRNVAEQLVNKRLAPLAALLLSRPLDAGRRFHEAAEPQPKRSFASRGGRLTIGRRLTTCPTILCSTLESTISPTRAESTVDGRGQSLRCRRRSRRRAAALRRSPLHVPLPARCIRRACAARARRIESRRAAGHRVRRRSRLRSGPVPESR